MEQKFLVRFLEWSRLDSFPNLAVEWHLDTNLILKILIQYVSNMLEHRNEFWPHPFLKRHQICGKDLQTSFNRLIQCTTWWNIIQHLYATGGNVMIIKHVGQTLSTVQTTPKRWIVTGYHVLIIFKLHLTNVVNMLKTSSDIFTQQEGTSSNMFIQHFG